MRGFFAESFAVLLFLQTSFRSYTENLPISCRFTAVPFDILLQWRLLLAADGCRKVCYRPSDAGAGA